MRQDIKACLKDLVIGLALVGLAVAIATCTGCTSMTAEYEHISHPFAGWPFGPQSEEDTLDQLNLCLVKRGDGDRFAVYGASCLGYRLTDGGFYGPSLTGGFKAGVEFSFARPPTDTDSHNALGGYRDACGELPGMVGDDC